MQHAFFKSFPLFFVLLICGCSGPKHVTTAEFKKQYAAQPESMRNTTYLGQRDGKAFIQVSTMSAVGQKWSDEVIYVNLDELDPAFRDSLPKKEMKVP